MTSIDGGNELHANTLKSRSNVQMNAFKRPLVNTFRHLTTFLHFKYQNVFKNVFIFQKVLLIIY